MALSALNVTLNRSTYSRYERDRAVVVASITSTGAVGGESVEVSLKRDTPWPNQVRVVMTTTVTLDGSGKATATFNLADHRETAEDSTGKGITYNPVKFSARLNDYSAVATSGIYSASARFTVVVATPETMRRRWMMGLPLSSKERMAPKLQPVSITGVTVRDVSLSTRPGPYSLVLTVTAGPVKKLSWGGGTQVTIDLTGPSQLVLNGPGGLFYIMVDIDPTLLPAVTTTEALTIVNEEMSDESIAEGVVEATEYLQSKMGVRLEPTRIISRLLVDFGPTLTQEYDEVGIPVDYRRPPDMMQWMDVHIPYHSLLKPIDIQGWWNRTNVVKITPDWYAHDEKSGLVRLIPSAASSMGWQFFGPGYYSFFQSYTIVPDFWNYDAVVGLREMPTEIMTWVAKRSASTLISKAAEARYGGVQSFSLSRDGISESKSSGGLYGNIMRQYDIDTGRDQQGNEKGIASLRDRYCGLRFVTI